MTDSSPPDYSFVWSSKDSARPHSLALSHDRRFVFSGGTANTLVKRDLRTGEIVTSVTATHNSINIWMIALASPTSLVSCGFGDNVVKVWNLDLEQQQELQHPSKVYSVAASPDLLASRCESGVVGLWELGGEEKWEKKKSLEDHKGSVYAMVFSSNGEMLATSGMDKKINVYSVANDFSRMHTLEGHTGWVWSLSFSPESTRLVSCSNDKAIRCGIRRRERC